MSIKPRTLRSLIDEINQPDLAEETPLERIHRYACSAAFHAVHLMPQHWDDGLSPANYVLFVTHLQHDLRQLILPPELDGNWPRGHRITFGSRPADSALDAIIRFATEVMHAAAPMGLAQFASFRIAPKVAPVFHQACRAWLKNVESGRAIPRPGDWPRWKLHHDVEEVADQLAKEVDEMRGTRTVYSSTVIAKVIDGKLMFPTTAPAAARSRLTREESAIIGIVGRESLLQSHVLERLRDERVMGDPKTLRRWARILAARGLLEPLEERKPLALTQQGEKCFASL